ncbi:hypothetical protein AB0L06_35985 [Spirillospora sp. NPDC052269]
MQPLSHLADRDDAVAFSAFHTFASPALRVAARWPLQRARHTSRPCASPTGQGWCAECEATVDDLLLESFTRLRSALDGEMPTTRSGQPVREMVLACDHLASSEAQSEDTAAWALELRREGRSEPAWLRATRAQLVHYPLRHLEERTRRADAVRRGASARPDRDLRQAAWAAPLRDDPASLDMLILAVFRTRRRVPDLLQVPDDLQKRYKLTPVEASRRMSTALTALHKVNPGFFAANIDDAIPSRDIKPPIDPQERHTTAVGQIHARRSLARLLTSPANEPAPCAARRRAYQHIVAAICAIATGQSVAPATVAARELDITPKKAERLVRRLAVLVSKAGVDWTDHLTEAAPAAAVAQ